MKSKYTEEDWKEIQAYADEGKTWRDIEDKFNISMATLASAKKQGKFKGMPAEMLLSKQKQNSTGRTSSEETKLKISTARKKYLSENKDQIWRTHSRFKSIPCEKFKELLNSNNIQFVEEYKPLLHLNRYFSIDVAFPKRKVGIEINGNQHYDKTTKGLKPYYQERHDLIEAEGWKLYEIPYNKAFDHDFMLKLVMEIMLDKNIKIDQNFVPYTKTKKLSFCSCGNEKCKTAKRCLICSGLARRKTEKPSKEELQKLINNYSYVYISKIYNISDKAIKKWCENYGIERE